MRQIGKRKEPPITPEATGENLAGGVEFSADMAKLAGGSVMFPKGVFRYKTHEEANAHQELWLARGMAQLARARRHG